MLSHAAGITAAQKSIHLVKEDYCRRSLLHELLQCLDAALRLTVKLRHDVAWAYVEERCLLLEFHSSCAGQHRLAATRRAIKKRATRVTTHPGKKRRIGHSWPDDGLAQGALRILQPNHIFKASTTPEAADVHARSLQFSLHLGEGFITVAFGTGPRTFCLFILHDTWLPARLALAVAVGRSLGAELTQLALQIGREILLEGQLLSQELHLCRAVSYRAVYARGCSRAWRSGCHSRHASVLRPDKGPRLLQRHPHIPFGFLVWQHALNPIQVRS
mmetsp:Transcript_91992/g.269097  ORF Transcript_91992/g.269097 Transcript_91992/m.269097 type:complete len:274 (+) Transcript_91992:524-1345(+)